MEQESIVSSRSDRELRKKIIIKGDYSVVPYEDSRCKVALREVTCVNSSGGCDIERESRVFSANFDGNILIGDSDFFIDRDFELILQQMCCGESCEATMVYTDGTGALVKEITCKIDLKEVTEEQLISDWSSERLFEAANHHKDRGVALVKEKRITDAFKRFNKALKMLIAIEPLDPATVEEERVKEMIDLKIKIYNNLAYCQLQYNEFEAVRELCDKALQFDTDNVKSLYRRSMAYTGLNLHEEAWKDIQRVLQIDPTDKAALQQANVLKPIVEKINTNYSNVIKKMFVYIGV